MSRRDEITRKRLLLEKLLKPAKKEKVVKVEKKQVIDADLNDDGKVDEKDLDLVREAVEVEKKKKKKIVKKK